MSIVSNYILLFCRKRIDFLNSENKKSPYRFVPYLHPDNSNGRCSGTILTGNTCVTVPVIGGGDNCYFCAVKIVLINILMYMS